MIFRNITILTMRFASLAVRCVSIFIASTAIVASKSVLLHSVGQPEQSLTKLMPAQTLASYPEGSFLESIAINSDGTIYFSRLMPGEIFARLPTGETLSVATNPNGTFSGLALDSDEVLYAVGGQQGKPQNTVYRIGEEGTIDSLMQISGAQELNGITLLQPDVLLATDSKAGIVWRIDIDSRTATVWLQDELR